jgi:uncharacterized PurR-regulated membrane protein YhhQ (DUF165 family)
MIAVYVSAIVAANLLVATFVSAISPINAFLLIGLDLALRDCLHEKWKNSKLILKMGGVIFGSGVISFVFDQGTGVIALASMAAFIASNIADALMYHVLRAKPYLVKSNGSNIVGSAVDSCVFPTLAFGSIMPEIMLLQFAAKFAGGFVWSIVLAHMSKREKAA